jgi:hypothetical protein
MDLRDNSKYTIQEWEKEMQISNKHRKISSTSFIIKEIKL